MNTTTCLICGPDFRGHSLHRFPKDKKRLTKWMEAIGKADLLEEESHYFLYNNARLCSAHFSDWCWCGGKDRKKFVRNAIPNQPDEKTEESFVTDDRNKMSVKQKNFTDRFKRRSRDDPRQTEKVDDLQQEGELREKRITRQSASQDRKRNEKTDLPDFMERGMEECLSEECDRDLEPERIIGATDATGELLFLIKWKDLDEGDIVSSAVAGKKWPELVIQFYEERLVWRTHNDHSKETES